MGRTADEIHGAVAHRRQRDMAGQRDPQREKRVARLACAGGANVARAHARYEGMGTCRAAALVAGAAAAQPFAFVPNEKSGTVSIIDTTKDAVVGEK